MTKKSEPDHYAYLKRRMMEAATARMMMIAIAKRRNESGDMAKIRRVEWRYSECARECRMLIPDWFKEFKYGEGT